MEIKRAEILKLKGGKFIIHPVNTLKGGGGIASPPYMIEENLTCEEVAQKLLSALEQSIIDAPRPLDWKAWQKHHLKSMGVRSMKELHDGSINIGVFTKNDSYYISPSINKGPKEGFHGATKDRIIIPLESTLEELKTALEEAFAKSS